jgi:hypothetical protein
VISVQCPSCQTQVFLECTCPLDYLLAAGQHQTGCTHENVDVHVICPPEMRRSAKRPDGCCPEDHDHGLTGNRCRESRGLRADEAFPHAGVPCPEPDSCRTWRFMIADALHPLSDGTHPLLAKPVKDGVVPPCPGGHCHRLIEDCAVCRPLVITVMPGTTIQSVATA